MSERERRDPRVSAEFRVDTLTIDAVRDPVTREPCFVESENDASTNLSRRGLRLRCARPPDIGTRLLLQIHADDGEAQPIEVIGRTCWTSVEYRPGAGGARAHAAVGVELVGGTPRALDRYERCLSKDENAPAAAPTSSVAGREASG